MYDEERYRTVLTEMNSIHFNKRNWLINNFELYKFTLNWPDNRPPISRSNLIKGTFRERFNATYKEILSEFDYELNYEKRMLQINSIKTKE
jgi:hypothetical protein